MPNSMPNPIQIGKHVLKSRVLVAPMSGVTDLPFRKVLAGFGPGLVVSEMVASARVATGDPENLAKAAGSSFISPLAVQLVGRDPHWMAEGARVCEAAGADIIDINMGCPARKVTGALSGSALMREPELALEIIEAVIEAVDVPVTLKMRLGWDETSLNASMIAQAAEALGVQMFVVHGRTRCQFYKGKADWAAVGEVVQAVSRPVFVNGDIFDGADARKALAQSGAQGVMVGRSLVGRPWDIAEICQAVDKLGDKLGDKRGDNPQNNSQNNLMHNLVYNPVHKAGDNVTPPLDKAAIAVAHYKDILDFYPTGKGVRFARKHLAGYCDAAGLLGSDPLRAKICQSLEPAQVIKALHAAFLQQANAA